MSDAPGATRTVQRALRLLGAVTENGGTLSDPLFELAGPHLDELAEGTGETANLAVSVEAGRAVYFRQVSSIGSSVASHADALSQSLGAPPKERVA
jgi:hypothetical protein